MSQSFYIGQLSSGIWTYDLNQNSSVSALAVSGCLVSNHLIGNFNNLCGTCWASTGYSLVSGMITPNYDLIDVSNTGNMLSDSDANVLRGLYLLTFYENLINSFSGPGTFSNQGVTNQNIGILSLTEGDSKITYESPARMMAVYRDILKQKRAELFYNVEARNRNANGSEIPRTLAFFNISYPGGGYNNYNNLG